MSKVVWGLEKPDGAEANLTRLDKKDAWNIWVDDGMAGCQMELSKDELFGLYATIKNELQIAGD